MDQGNVPAVSRSGGNNPLGGIDMRIHSRIVPDLAGPGHL